MTQHKKTRNIAFVFLVVFSCWYFFCFFHCFLFLWVLVCFFVSCFVSLCLVLHRFQNIFILSRRSVHVTIFKYVLFYQQVTYYITVKPVNKGHRRERQHLVFIDKLSLFGDYMYIILFYQGRVTEVWPLFTGRPLFGGDL